MMDRQAHRLLVSISFMCVSETVDSIDNVGLQSVHELIILRLKKCFLISSHDLLSFDNFMSCPCRLMVLSYFEELSAIIVLLSV